MTALSHLERRRTPQFSNKPGLARASLLAVLTMPFLSGCIVADPPQYEDPGRTPPILNLVRATPRIVEPYLQDRSDPSTKETMPLEVPVRSEDQGQDLIFAIHVDYTYPASRWLTGGSLPASTLSDTSRKITLYVPLQGILGCHPLTLLVAHEKQWDLGVNAPKPGGEDDTALATWWVNALPSSGGDAYTLADCPNRNEVEKGNP